LITKYDELKINNAQKRTEKQRCLGPNVAKGHGTFNQH